MDVGESMSIPTKRIIEELKQDPVALRKVYALYILETHQGMLKDKKIRELSEDEIIARYAKEKGFGL